MWFAATDDDYGYYVDQVHLTPGVTSEIIILAITDDDLLESAESLFISLNLPQPRLTKRGILPGNVTTALVTIVDNDGNYIIMYFSISSLICFRNYCIIVKCGIHC